MVIDKSKIESFNQKLFAQEHARGGPTGLCEDVALFQEALITFPDAPIRFRLRNFNRPEDITSVAILVTSLGDYNRAYCCSVNIVKVFPELAGWVAKVKKHNSTITISTFIEDGATLATTLKRKFMILHQYGSGNQEDASYNEYGPFDPVN